MTALRAGASSILPAGRAFSSSSPSSAPKLTEGRGEAPGATARRIINDIQGFDLNPASVEAARGNYLAALGEPCDAGAGSLPRRHPAAARLREVRLRDRQPAVGPLGLSSARVPRGDPALVEALWPVLAEGLCRQAGRRQEGPVHAVHLRGGGLLSQGRRHARLPHHAGSVQVEGSRRGLSPIPAGRRRPSAARPERARLRDVAALQDGRQ